MKNIPGDRVYLIVGRKDSLSTPKDNYKLAKSIGALDPIILESFGHVSFLITRNTVLQEKVLNCVNKADIKPGKIRKYRRKKNKKKKA